MKLYILANPEAGSRSAKAIVEKITQDFPELTIKLYLTQGIDDEKNQVSAILKEFTNKDRLLILGGDGTLSKTLAFWPEQFPFAYYPAGSGNDFAKALGIQQLNDTLNAILSNQQKSVFLLDSPFGVVANTIDIGFAAQVIAYSTNSRLKSFLKILKLGKLTYLLNALRSLFFHKTFTIQLSVDQHPYEIDNLFFLSVANNTYFGGGIMIWPEASAYKQQIDLVYIENGPLYRRVLALLDLVFKRHHQSNYIKHVQAQTVYLEAGREMPLQSDGEMLTGRAFELTCQERKIYL